MGIEKTVSVLGRPLVLYHGNCLDGFCAAWLASLRWPDAELVPQQYGDSVGYEYDEGGGVDKFLLVVDGETRKFDLDGRDVLVLDFSFKRDVLSTMRQFARSVLVLDHHATARDDLDGLDFAVFDMGRSGAGLALDVFFPGARGAVRWTA